MNVEDVDRIFRGLEDALENVATVRGNAELYSQQADRLVKYMRVICDEIDIGDPRLASFGESLSRELLFATKSAELRSPVIGLGKMRSGAAKY